MMLTCWAPIIPARSFKPCRAACGAAPCAAICSYLRPLTKLLLALVVASLACSGAPQPSLETLAANYRKAPNPRTRAAVLHFAAAHPNDQPGALALLVLGSTEIDQRQFAAVSGSVNPPSLP